MALVIRWSSLGSLALLIVPFILAACSLSGNADPTATLAPVGTIAAATAGASTAPATARPSGGPPSPAATLPSATAPPATPATPTRPAATPGGGAATPGPLAGYPVGWRVYQGQLPFAIAYPSDWTVDESQLGNNLVYFFAPVSDQSIFVVIATTGAPERDPNLDVLRDRWFTSRTRECARTAVDRTAREVWNGLEFATVGATCDLPTGLAYSYTGLGIRGTVPWIFEFNAPYNAYATTLEAVFRKMIQSLNIYGGVR